MEQGNRPPSLTLPEDTRRAYEPVPDNWEATSLQAKLLLRKEREAFTTKPLSLPPPNHGTLVKATHTQTACAHVRR